MHTGRKRVCHYTHFTHPEGREKKGRGRESVLSRRNVVSSRITSSVTICSLHLTPSIFHRGGGLRRFTYDGNGSLPRRAPIKGASRFTFTRHRRPVFRCFPPTGWIPRFSDRFDTIRRTMFRHCGRFLVRCLRSPKSMVSMGKLGGKTFWFWKMCDFRKREYLGILFDLEKDYVRDFTKRRF